jgi:hypothetical protein
VSSLKFWVLMLSLVSFGAGLAAGVFWTTQKLRIPEPPGPFDQYREQLIREFRIPEDRRKYLSQLLTAYERDIASIKALHESATMEQMEPELADRGRYYRDLIQNKLLQGPERERFQQLVTELPTKPH